MEDAELRKFALSVSVDLYKLWVKNGEVNATLEHQIEDIRIVADTFYTFLKGENK